MTSAEAAETAETADLWSAGDYSVIATQIAPGADALLDAIEDADGPIDGRHLLDVAAGTGNVAEAALRRGARVLATDITPRLVDIGRRRTSGYADRVEWQVADALALPVADGSQAIVTSAFGIIFVPRHDALVNELGRALGPGGLLAFTAWLHEPELEHPFAAPLMRRLPRDDDAPGSDDWGVESTVRQRLDPAFDDVGVVERTLDFVSTSAADVTESLLTASPLHLAAMSAIPIDEHEDVRREFVEGLRPYEGADGFRRTERYLVVTARRR